jgi:hypothetical protein
MTDLLTPWLNSIVGTGHADAPALIDDILTHVTGALGLSAPPTTERFVDTVSRINAHLASDPGQSVARMGTFAGAVVEFYNNNQARVDAVSPAAGAALGAIRALVPSGGGTGTNAGATAGQPSGGWIDRFWNQAKSGAKEIGQKLTGGQGAGAAVGNVFDVAVKGPLSFLGKAWRKAQTIESPFARSAIVGGVGLVAALLGLKAFQHGGKISAGAGLLVVLAAAVGYGRDAVLPYTPDSPRVVPA